MKKQKETVALVFKLPVVNFQAAPHAISILRKPSKVGKQSIIWPYMREVFDKQKKLSGISGTISQAEIQSNTGGCLVGKKFTFVCRTP